MSGSTYVLEGSTSDLKNHVGHEVEIRGRLESSSSSSASGAGTTGSTAGATGSTSGSTGTATGAGSTGAAGGTASGSMSSSQQKLRVESVRMVSSTCSSR